MRRLILILAVVALFLPVAPAQAAGCSSKYESCLVWCTGPGQVLHGGMKACGIHCERMYCVL